MNTVPCTVCVGESGVRRSGYCSSSTRGSADNRFPERPSVVVFGGKKPSDKFAVIGNLLGLADRILIGGGMGYTFLAGRL